MSRKSRNARHIEFQPNCDWVTQHSHMYAPSNASSEARFLQASWLLKTDAKFRRVVEQLPVDKYWYLAILLGATTVSIKIYDAEEVDNLNRHPVSSSVVREKSVFVKIDRKSRIDKIDASVVDRIMVTAPLIYADRQMTAVEIMQMRNLQVEPNENRSAG